MSNACVHVKICGVRNPSDLSAAVAAEPDAVGLLVGQQYVSEDFIATSEARRLIARLPAALEVVLVTHISEPDAVLGLLQETGAQALQLHGSPTPAEVCEIRRRVTPGFRVIVALHADTCDLMFQARQYERAADAFVVDTRCVEEGRVGGTGRTHDWQVTAEFVKQSRVPVILAGGLTPENVRTAIDVVRPWGVDVNSGVENPRGGKSMEKCRRFVLAARGT